MVDGPTSWQIIFLSEHQLSNKIGTVIVSKHHGADVVRIKGDHAWRELSMMPAT